MADPEMSVEAIGLRHEYADEPSEQLNGLKRINLVYSSLGRQAHQDRGFLLAVIATMDEHLVAPCPQCPSEKS